MNIDGQCHCGVSNLSSGDRSRARVDLSLQQIARCLTGSPYRVTAICSGDQIRMTGKVPKVYAKTGDTAGLAFSILPGMRFAAFHQREGGPDDWGIRWGSIRQRDRLKPRLQSGADPRCHGSAVWRNCPGDQPTRHPTCTEGVAKAKHGMEGG